MSRPLSVSAARAPGVSLDVTASALGDLPLALWLLVKGVDAQRWKEKAGERRV